MVQLASRYPGRQPRRERAIVVVLGLLNSVSITRKCSVSPASTNPCFRLKLSERGDATFTDGRVMCRFADSRRVFPTTLAFAAFSRQPFHDHARRAFLRTHDLHLRNYENVAQFVAITLQQIVTLTRSRDLQSRFKRAADLFGNSRFFQRL